MTPGDPTAPRSRAPAIQTSASAQRPSRKADRPLIARSAIPKPSAPQRALSAIASSATSQAPSRSPAQWSASASSMAISAAPEKSAAERARVNAWRSVRTPDVGIPDGGGVAADAAQRADLGLGRAGEPRGCERFLGKAVRLVEVALHPERVGQDAQHLGARDRRRVGRQKIERTQRDRLRGVRIARSEVIDARDARAGRRCAWRPARGSSRRRARHAPARSPGRTHRSGRPPRRSASSGPGASFLRRSASPTARGSTPGGNGRTRCRRRTSAPPRARRAAGPAAPGARRAPRTSGERARRRPPRRFRVAVRVASTAAATAAWSASRSPGRSSS